MNEAWNQSTVNGNKQKSTSKELAEQEGVAETLKAKNQMDWVVCMNNTRNQAIEIVNANLIYA